MLRTNRFDPYGYEHATFFSDLNALNGGTGYPQQTENVGVSFGTPAPNPYAGQDWVSIDVWGGAVSGQFEVLAGTAEGGSYLPRDVTRIWGYAGSGFADYELSRLEPKQPTFIPYNSALHIENGVSRFPEGSRFEPLANSFHDQVPQAIVTPLMTRLGYVTPPAPLAVSISGPTTLTYNAIGTWTAAFNRSSAAGYTYAWEWRIVLTSCFEDELERSGTPKGGVVMRPTQCLWSVGGSNPTYSYRADSDAMLELRVTVSNGTESATSNVFRVRTGNGPGGGVPLLDAAASEAAPNVDAAMQAEAAPAQTALERVWPVPAVSGDAVRMAYALAESGTIQVQVLDVLGRVVGRHEDAKAAGRHVLAVPTQGLPAGAYVLTLTANGQSFTRRLVLR